MLKISKSKAELEKTKANWDSIAFVPTMGALHEGHLSLLRLARKHANKVIVSIYVNPTQFAPHEDFDAYPRDIKADLTKLEGLADLVYSPAQEELYPNGPEISVKAGEAAKGLETDFRPHFFDGVCTIVHKLFEHVKPNIAVFGEKDYQQLMVIKEMVENENLPIEIVGGPVIRDKHGLALSSRNAYLNEKELEIARQLNKILIRHCEEGEARRGNPDAGLLRDPSILSGIARNDEIKNELLAAGFTKVDYIEDRWNRLLAAAWIGKTRLIDNVELKTTNGHE